MIANLYLKWIRCEWQTLPKLGQYVTRHRTENLLFPLIVRRSDSNLQPLQPGAHCALARGLGEFGEGAATALRLGLFGPALGTRRAF